MNQPTFETYAAEAKAMGFDEVVERKWAPSLVLDTHTHPFSVKALVVQGEIWLTIGNDIRHLRPGDAFTVDREQPHAERYGSEGATYWAARRNSR